MRRKQFQLTCEDIEHLESHEDFDLDIPSVYPFSPSLSKSAPCGCCGGIQSCSHCSKIAVVIYSCPPDNTVSYPGQAIAGCTVHVKTVGGVDVAGSPFTTTSDLNPLPQIILDSSISSVFVTFTYPSGSTFTPPGSAFTVAVSDCHTYKVTYSSVLPSSQWFCDCCGSTCCETDGSSIPIFYLLDWTDGVDSDTGTFGRSHFNNYWSITSASGINYKMRCSSGGNMELTVVGGGDTVTGTAAPTACDPFSTTFSIDISGSAGLLATHSNISPLVFTASLSSTPAFNGDWTRNDNGISVYPFCNTDCSPCNTCAGKYPPLQLHDQRYGSGSIPLTGAPLTATDTGVSVTGGANTTDCNNHVLSTITTTLRYTLNCNNSTGLTLRVDFWTCCNGFALGPQSLGCQAAVARQSDPIALASVNCRDPILSFRIPGQAGINPYNSDTYIDVTSSGGANICPDCACAMLDAYSTLHVTDPVYGGSTAIKCVQSVGYWVAQRVISGTTYEYRFTCGTRPGYSLENGFYFYVVNLTSGNTCVSTNNYTSVSNCANPSFSFTMPSGGPCGLYPSGTIITVGP